MRSHHVPHDGLTLVTLLPPCLPSNWDCWNSSPDPFNFFMLPFPPAFLYAHVYG